MLEVAIDAREEQKKIASDIEQAIQLQLIKVKREFRFKKWKNLRSLLFVVQMAPAKHLSPKKYWNMSG